MSLSGFDACRGLEVGPKPCDVKCSAERGALALRSETPAVVGPRLRGTVIDGSMQARSSRWSSS